MVISFLKRIKSCVIIHWTTHYFKNNNISLSQNCWGNMLQRIEIILGNSYQRIRESQVWMWVRNPRQGDRGRSQVVWILVYFNHFFFPGQAFLRPLLQLGTVRTIWLPCLLAPQGVGQACSLPGLRVRVCPGLEAWLRCFAHLLGGFECRAHAQYPAFASGSSKVAIGFLVSLDLYHLKANIYTTTKK